MLSARFKLSSWGIASKKLSKIQEGCLEVRDCWKCKKAVDCLKAKFFCPMCSAIQPVEGENFFDYLGVKPSFDVDVSLLKENFLKLQSQIHPDKFATCSQKEKEISENCSSYLNSAYHTLSEPLRRAEYLLQLKGECSSKEITKESDFLVEMMELNEKADSLETDSDIRNMLHDVDGSIDALGDQFKRHFETGDFEAAKQIVLKMGFYSRLKVNLNRKLRLLE